MPYGRRQTDLPYRRPEIALVLGGGSGLRGLCHLGVLDVFAEARLPVTCLLGAGAGAVLAAGYAFDTDPAALRARVFAYLLSEPFRSSPLFRYFVAEKSRDLSFLKTIFAVVRRFVRIGSLSSTQALVGEQPLIELVKALVPEGDFDRTRVPLRLVALDLKSGREVVLSEGDVRTAARASASLSSLFPPVEINDLLLVDNGILMSLPVHAARNQAEPGDLVVAVDISDTPTVLETYESALDVLLRVHHAYGRLLNDQHLACADVAVRPEPEGPVAGCEFDRELLEDLVDAGRRAARASLPGLRRRMLAGGERALAGLALCHGFVGDAGLDECIEETLGDPNRTLAETLYRRRVVSPQVLGAMVELVHRRLANGHAGAPDESDAQVAGGPGDPVRGVTA